MGIIVVYLVGKYIIFLVLMIHVYHVFFFIYYDRLELLPVLY